ncbi:DUF397 domain-containing protein [Amycolatopsis sp. WQ 127309]|uniref:DUF397 domain-containing protein n=1 Tax=Amycolatopsis sp. WQ 127309 TaxID=2932773 RepID=UPI001FF229BC|nr:DUF397 domain-containing protein [Amycolatopsis sp. WQ 127309]UOZ10355.1 DUF397 domain-containing protein [Amycolatopsis sp. WQ 127309]
MPDFENPPISPRKQKWFRSSYSDPRGGGVEVHFKSDAILVRESENRRTDAPLITFSPTTWAAFLHAMTPQEDQA